MNRLFWVAIGASLVLGIIYWMSSAYADDKPATAPKADALVTKTITDPKPGHEFVMMKSATGEWFPVERKIEASASTPAPDTTEPGDKVTLITIPVPAETKHKDATDKAATEWEVPEGAELVTDSTGRTRLRAIAPAVPTAPVVVERVIEKMVPAPVPQAAPGMTREEFLAAMATMRQPATAPMAPTQTIVPPGYVVLDGKLVRQDSLTNPVHCTTQTCAPATPAPAAPQPTVCHKETNVRVGITFAPQERNYFPQRTYQVPRARYIPVQQPPREIYCPPPPRDPRPCPPGNGRHPNPNGPRVPGRHRGR